MHLNNQIHLGLIGTGRMGRIRAESIAFSIRDARLIAVASENHTEAKQFGSEYEITKVFGDYHQILQDPAVDAVLICTPSVMHTRLITEVARAGKHIFCEKPIGLNLDEIDRALAVVAASGVTLQIGFNRRFDPNFRHVREVIARGDIGSPHILRITNRDPALPTIAYVKTSGGLFLDFALHDFDMARFLIAQEVKRIYAVGATRIDPRIAEAGDIDTALITLEFIDGTLGTIDNSRQAVYGYDQRVEVFGSGGMISSQNNTAHRTVLADEEGVHKPLPLHNFSQRYWEAYVEEMRSFVDALQNDTKPLVTGEDGRQAVALALAAQRSYVQQGPVDVCSARS